MCVGTLYNAWHIVENQFVYLFLKLEKGVWQTYPYDIREIKNLS